MNGWVRIDSWHLLATWTRVPGRALTLCGRTVQDPPTSAELPGNEKSCETCLRLFAGEQAEATDAPTGEVDDA
jgi:hypothetical protein